jgi:hypothetical protein
MMVLWSVIECIEVLLQFPPMIGDKRNVHLYLSMTTTVAVSSRMEQPKVNPLLGPALKSLYDIEVYLENRRSRLNFGDW